MKFPKRKYSEINHFFSNYTDNLNLYLQKTNLKKLKKITKMIEDTIRNKNKIFICGNGGSAAIANHYVADYLKLLRTDTNLKPKIISFVAGIKSKKYLKINRDIQFLRAMPNTSSRFNLGITALFNSTFSQSNLKKIIMLFKKVGIVIHFNEESKIDTFTGMVGSGPAYFFYLLKSYEKKLIPLCKGDKNKANEIMMNLIKGVGASIENNKNLDELIAAVASKKGTTEAGLKSFKLQKLDKIFEQGISAAVKRSKEISNEN